MFMPDAARCDDIRAIRLRLPRLMPCAPQVRDRRADILRCRLLRADDAADATLIRHALPRLCAACRRTPTRER